MEFIIDTAALKRAVRLMGIARIKELENKEIKNSDLIVIDVYSDYVEFYSSNSAVAVSVKVESGIDIESEGRGAVNYDELSLFLRPYNPLNDKGHGTDRFHFIEYKGNIEIRNRVIHKDNTVTDNFIKMYKLQGSKVIKPSKFGVPTFSIYGKTIKKALKKVMFPVSPTSPNDFSTIVKLDFKKDRTFVFCGTDRAVLSEYKVKVEKIKKDSVLLSYHIVACIINANIPDDSQVLFEVDNGIVRVYFDGVCISGGMVKKCSYPDYSNHITDYESYIDLDRDTFLENISHIHDMLNKDDSYRLKVEIDNDVLTLSTSTVMARRSIDTDHKGKLCIEFNGHLLMSAIKSTSEGVIRMHYTNATTHVIFLSGENFNHLILISPVQQ